MIWYTYAPTRAHAYYIIKTCIWVPYQLMVYQKFRMNIFVYSLFEPELAVWLHVLIIHYLSKVRVLSNTLTIVCDWCRNAFFSFVVKNTIEVIICVIHSQQEVFCCDLIEFIFNPGCISHKSFRMVFSLMKIGEVWAKKKHYSNGQQNNRLDEFIYMLFALRWSSLRLLVSASVFCCICNF